MITRPVSPKRIISLVPSQTELLVELGLENEIVGITKFCIHPTHLRKTKTIIGGTKNFNFSLINELKPDLIIGNKEENYKEGIEQLQAKYSVWISDISTMADALNMITIVGELTGKDAQASALIYQIQKSFSTLIPFPQAKRVAYFIWRKPYMVAASVTFIHHMLTLCGFTNVFVHLSRYPEVSPEQISLLEPDLIFLSSEPYPFNEKHLQEFSSMCPEAIVELVDGEMFSWYGSRLVHSATYFKNIIQKLSR